MTRQVRQARSAVFRGVATMFLVTSALVTTDVLPAAATTGSTSCPRGPAAVIDVAYVLFHLDGTSNNVSTLQGNVRLGDTVNALVNVPALPPGCAQVQLSLASYSSGDHAAGRTRIPFSSDTGEFLPGGRYEMSVTIAPPPPPRSPRVRFRLAFATGPVLTSPHYGHDLIASARN